MSNGIRGLIFAGVSALGIASGAAAQDIVVMRRTVAAPNWAAHAWQGDLVSDAPACSATAPAHRTSVCVNRTTGSQVANEMCNPATRPSATGTVRDMRACQYAWNEPLFGNYAEACSDATYRTRTITCQAYTGSQAAFTVEDALCVEAGRGAKKAERQDAANYSGCGYDWIVTSGACEGSKRRRQVQCQRSGGSSATTFVTGTLETSCPTPKPSELIDDTSCAPPSPLVNGDFEADFASWTTTNGSNASYAVEVAGGSKAAVIRSRDDWSGVHIYQTVSLKPSTTYTLSYDVALLPGFGTGEMQPQAQSGGPTGASLGHTTHDISSTTKTRRTLTFTTPAQTGTVTLRLMGWSKGTREANKPTAFLIDNVEVK